MLTESDFKYLVGKPINEAKNELPQGYFIFVEQEDGESFWRGQEANFHRVNVFVKRGVITHIQGVN